MQSSFPPPFPLSSAAVLIALLRERRARVRAGDRLRIRAAGMAHGAGGASATSPRVTPASSSMADFRELIQQAGPGSIGPPRYLTQDLALLARQIPVLLLRASAQRAGWRGLRIEFKNKPSDAQQSTGESWAQLSREGAEGANAS